MDENEAAVPVLDIEKLSDRGEYVNGMAYGPMGTGKTVFLASAPRPILLLDSEGGTHSIGNKDGIDVASITSLETYREVLRLLEGPAIDNYETLGLDSTTEGVAGLMKEIMSAAVASAAADDEVRDPYSPQFAEWRKLTEVFREIVRSYRDLPINLVLTALEREDEDELTGRVKVRPRLSPALADDVPNFLDFVGYMYTKGDIVDGRVAEADREPLQRVMLLRPTIKHMAKLRAPEGTNPPDLLISPTFDEVAALVLGK